MNCEFSIPLNYLGTEPVEGEPFSFSEMTCEFETLQHFENLETESEFYINKTINYSDIIIIFFLIFFFLISISKIIWNFVWNNWNSKL